jgi:beta-glucosidase
MLDTDTLEVRVTVQNTGSRAGKEIVQLYVRDVDSTVMRPTKELKQFAKVDLQPGEKTTVTMTLDKRSFAYYNVQLKDWHVESGQYEILIGRSSEDIALRDTLNVESTVKVKTKVDRSTLLADLMNDPDRAPVVQGLIQSFQSGMGASMDSDSMKDAMGEGTGEMFAEMMKYMPLRAMVSFSQGAFTDEMLDGLLAQLNQH